MIKGGITERSADVLQRWFPAGETPIPSIDKASIVSKAGVQVFVFDDHAFSHGFKSMNSLTHMIVLSEERYGHQRYVDKDYMSLVIPPKIPLFNVRTRGDADMKVDPRVNVCGIGEFHLDLKNKYMGRIHDMDEEIDNHGFLGVSLYTVSERDKRGMHCVALTRVFKGLADMVNLWADTNLEPVYIGSKLWFYWALRTEGYEDEERVAQLQGGEYPTPAGLEHKQYVRLEPWVQSTNGPPPIHVRRSRLYPGRPPIFIGRVVKLNRGAAGGSTTSTRFVNLAKDLLYPTETSAPVTAVAKAISRMPVLSVSLSCT